MSIFFVVLFVFTSYVIKDYVAEKEKDEESESIKSYKLVMICLVIATCLCGADAMEHIENYFNSANYEFVEIGYYGLFFLLFALGMTGFIVYKAIHHYLKYKEYKKEKKEHPEEPKGYDELGDKMSWALDYSITYLIFGCFFFFMFNLAFFKSIDYSQEYACIDNVIYTNINDEYTFGPSSDYKGYICTTQEKMEEHITKDNIIYKLMKYHRLFKVPVIDMRNNQPIFLSKDTNIKVNLVNNKE